MSIEKHITLEEVPSVELFGAENTHLNTIRKAFANSKIIARDNQIRIQGTQEQVTQLTTLFDELIVHYQQVGELTTDQLALFLQQAPLPAQAHTLIIRGVDGRAIVPRTQNQRLLYNAFQAYDLVFAVGPSGTGKTFLSVAWALSALRRKEIKRIVITRPAVEAGESLGFLPGELQEKITPYIQPIYDALHQMLPPDRLAFYQEKGIIEIIPLAYMRGRTLSHDFIILDEAQNTTKAQLKMLLTRMGVGARVVVTGDLSQVDLPNNKPSGLQDAMQRFQHIQDIAFVRLDQTDVMRHGLVRALLQAYDV